jgi:putative oxidoreductase
VRRLYSTFASGWPGIGLLIMRLVVGLVLLLETSPKLWSDSPLHLAMPSTLLAGLGSFLAVGLWTPLVGATAAAIQAWQILTVSEHPVLGLLTGTMAAALAMLGPGRWSIDARRFGWRRIDVPGRKK